ncbi:mCG144529, partial [Mus musculus]
GQYDSVPLRRTVLMPNLPVSVEATSLLGEGHQGRMCRTHGSFQKTQLVCVSISQAWQYVPDSFLCDKQPHLFLRTASF